MSKAKVVVRHDMSNGTYVYDVFPNEQSAMVFFENIVRKALGSYPTDDESSTLEDILKWRYGLIDDVVYEVDGCVIHD